MNYIGKNAVAAWRSLGLERALTGVLIVLTVLLFAQGARFLLAGRHERAVLKSLVAPSSATPERAKPKPVTEYDQAILDHGMLGNSRQPIRLWGIMGDNALFGATADEAQPFKAGDTLSNGEKIVEVRLNDVTLEKDAKRRTEVVFEELKMPPGPSAMSVPGAEPSHAPRSTGVSPLPSGVAPQGELRPSARPPVTVRPATAAPETGNERTF